MTFKPAIWYPVAVVLSVLNWASAGYALRGAEAAHTAVHVVLALAFGFWATRLRRRPDTRELPAPDEAFDALQDDVGRLRQELSETQERLDFAERMLAQGREQRRADPPR